MNNLLSEFLEKYPSPPNPTHSPARFAFLLMSFIKQKEWNNECDPQFSDRICANIIQKAREISSNTSAREIDPQYGFNFNTENNDNEG